MKLPLLLAPALIPLPAAAQTATMCRAVGTEPFCSYAGTVEAAVGRRPPGGRGGDVVGGASLIAGNWRISAIDGRPVRLERPAKISFIANRLQGKICNGYGGEYRFRRGMLTTTRVISTQMACAGGSSEVETAFFRSLRQTLKVHRGVDTLVLWNGRTRVTLRRFD